MKLLKISIEVSSVIRNSSLAVVFALLACQTDSNLINRTSEAQSNVPLRADTIYISPKGDDSEDGSIKKAVAHPRNGLKVSSSWSDYIFARWDLSGDRT